MVVDLIVAVSIAVRTRDAIRRIRGIPVDPIIQKMLLAEWFQEHRRAARSVGDKRRAYDKLLGRKQNRRLSG